ITREKRKQERPRHEGRTPSERLELRRQMGAAKKSDRGVSPARDEDFPAWFQSVVKEAEVAELDHAPGCLVIRPWGYAIWELMQAALDGAIKRTGAQNAYFPLFIPVSYFEREAEHVEGFAKEMAVVTHHRLEQD